jgi:hypothetical protein
VDLWSPLLALALVADAEDDGGRRRDLVDVARELTAVRDADAETGPTAHLVEALQAIRDRHGETLPPAELLEALRARPGWAGLTSFRRLAALLGPLGIVRRQIREGDQRRWRYVLDQRARTLACHRLPRLSPVRGGEVN